MHDCVCISDSKICNLTTEFQCPNRRCIPKSWHCDRKPDCIQGADEKNCTGSCNSHNEFQCDDGWCINAKWHCDGETDCRDMSDEKDCCKIIFHFISFLDHLICSVHGCILGLVVGKTLTPFFQILVLKIIRKFLP